MLACSATAFDIPQVCRFPYTRPKSLSKHSRICWIYGTMLSLQPLWYRDAQKQRCSVADGFITKNQGELAWPKNGQQASHCVSLSTTHRYNPRLNNSKGDWELTWDMEGHQGVRDLFCLKKAKWYYIGTYEWAGQACSPYKKLAFAKPVR